MRRPDARIQEVSVSAYRIPTDYPESDGTLEWNGTTLVLAEVSAADKQGIGYTYADRSTARLIQDLLADVVRNRDALDTGACWMAMVKSVRNLGRPGIASMAISAVDAALWDLKSAILGIALIDLLGAVRDGIEVYGSGGFTSYDKSRLQGQLSGWVAEGMRKVKIKVGREPAADVARVEAAREAIGDEPELFVDANGAYRRKEALAFAREFGLLGVSWFEEPVSSDDLEGLGMVREASPAGMEIAAGEYGYDGFYFERMLAAGAVDVLQADASRCAGISGFLRAAELCEAHSVPLSAHCCPALHAQVCCAAPAAVHMEYFHDHTRIERMLFEGAPEPVNGVIRPDRSRPGLGLVFKKGNAKQYEL